MVLVAAARRLHLDAATAAMMSMVLGTIGVNQMININSIKKDLIKSHPTFVCPISGEILDYRTSHLIRFKHRGVFKTDIISHNGYNKLTDEQRNKLEISIISDIEEL